MSYEEEDTCHMRRRIHLRQSAILYVRAQHKPVWEGLGCAWVYRVAAHTHLSTPDSWSGLNIANVLLMCW
jgi:hypothetical protein